jgi:hypothetical protein
MAVTRFTGAQNDSGPSGVDLTGKEFFLGRKNAAGAIVLAAAGEKVDGVISEGKPVGKWSSMHTGNQLKAVAGVAIAVGQKLASRADGKVGVAAAGNQVFGTAKSNADAGELVEINFDQEGPAA